MLQSDCYNLARKRMSQNNFSDLAFGNGNSTGFWKISVKSQRAKQINQHSNVQTQRVKTSEKIIEDHKIVTMYTGR